MTSRVRKSWPAWLVLIILSTSAHAQSTDVQALNLQVPDSPAPTRADTDVDYDFELAPGYTVWREATFPGSPPGRYDARETGAISLKHTFSAHLHAFFSDELDVWEPFNQTKLGGRGAVNTLHEAYLSFFWRQAFFDVGRFNEKIGVAYGYNPSDEFRHDAVISATSSEPSVLRSNRLGTAGVRFQYLTEGTSYEFLFAPAMDTRPSSGVLSPEFARTNSDNQALFQVSRTLSERTLVAGMLYWRDGQGVDGIVNLSTAVGRRTVFYVENVATPAARIDQRALSVYPDAPYASSAPSSDYHYRGATGVSVAVTPRVSVVLEYDQDGTGLDRAEEYAWAHPQTLLQLLDYVRIRNYADDAQDLLATRYAFLRVNLRNPFGPNTGLSAFTRLNLVDNSTFNWLELSKQSGKVTYALDVALTRGKAWSEFGTASYDSAVQLVVGVSL